MRRGGSDCRTTGKELKVYLTHLLCFILLAPMQFRFNRQPDITVNAM